MGIFFKCRFWFRRSGWGSQEMRCGWPWCCIHVFCIYFKNRMRWKTKAFLLCHWEAELLLWSLLKDKARIVPYYKLRRPHIKDVSSRCFSLQSLFHLDIVIGLVTDRAKKSWILWAYLLASFLIWCRFWTNEYPVLSLRDFAYAVGEKQCLELECHGILNGEEPPHVEGWVVS